MTTGSTQPSSESKEPLAAELVRDAEQGELATLKDAVVEKAKTQRLAEAAYFNADPNNDKEEGKVFVEAEQAFNEAVDRLIQFEASEQTR